MPSLTRFFHPVLPSSALRRDRPAGVSIGGRGFALFRDASGAPAAVTAPSAIYNGFTAASDPTAFDFMGRFVYARLGHNF